MIMKSKGRFNWWICLRNIESGRILWLFIEEKFVAENPAKWQCTIEIIGIIYKIMRLDWLGW